MHNFVHVKYELKKVNIHKFSHSDSYYISIWWENYFSTSIVCGILANSWPVAVRATFLISRTFPVCSARSIPSVVIIRTIIWTTIGPVSWKTKLTINFTQKIFWRKISQNVLFAERFLPSWHFFGGSSFSSIVIWRTISRFFKWVSTIITRGIVRTSNKVAAIPIDTILATSRGLVWVVPNFRKTKSIPRNFLVFC